LTVSNRRLLVSSPNARVITFIHDALGRLFQIEENGSDLAYHEYVGHYPGRIFIGGDPFNSGDLLRLSMANYQNFTGYRDAWGRVTQTDYRRRDDGMQAVKDFDYSYDYPSNIIYQEDHSAAALDELYSYDTLHRLTGFERGDLNGNKDAMIGPATREQSWTLDKLGNWIGIEADDTPPLQRLHNTANEIEAIGVEKDVFLRVEHDAAGNITYIPDTSSPCGDAGRRFTYDFRNRLIEVETTTNYQSETPAWSTVATCHYDGLNRKIDKVLDTGTDVVYNFDGWQCIEEREDDGGTWEARRQYVYGGIYSDEPLIFDKDYDSDGICTDFNYGGSRGAHRYYYAQQVNYNVTAMVVDDGDGSVTFIEWAEYDPYGAAAMAYAVNMKGGSAKAGFPRESSALNYVRAETAVGRPVMTASRSAMAMAMLFRASTGGMRSGGSRFEIASMKYSISVL